MRLFNKKPPLIMGIGENDQYFCLIYEKEGDVHTYWQEKPCRYEELLKHAQKVTKNFIAVRAVPHRYIWRKYLFFPAYYSEEQTHQQVIRYLKQELPLPIEEVFFDYSSELLDTPQALRVSVYALRKDYSEQQIGDTPTVLDCELHCMLRGIHYLDNRPAGKLEENSYEMGENWVQFKQDELLIQSQPIPNTNQFSVFGLDYSDEIYDAEVYVSALGAALWNGLK